MGYSGEVTQVIPVSGVARVSGSKLTGAAQPNLSGGGGLPGANGATFTPSVSEDGVISWTNDKGLTNPEPVNIMGAQGLPGKDGRDGEDGYTPVKGVDYFDGSPGAPGADGDPGEDGITPHIGDNGNWFIGDTDTGKPSRGATGENGKDGAAGYTPQKGVDYWTDQDKQEIADEVKESVGDVDISFHTENKNNPHNVTAEQVGAVPTSRKINNKALTSDITLTAADVGARASDWLPTAEELGINASGLSMVLLWENASYSSTFNAQTVTASGIGNSTQYQILVILTGGAAQAIVVNEAGRSTRLYVFSLTNESSKVVRNARNVNINSGSITFSDNVTLDTNGYGWITNDALKPYRVYGIKGV